MRYSLRVAIAPRQVMRMFRRKPGGRNGLAAQRKRPRLLGAGWFELELASRSGYFFFFGAAFFLAAAFFLVAFFID